MKEYLTIKKKLNEMARVKHLTVYYILIRKRLVKKTSLTVDTTIGFSKNDRYK